MRPISDQPGTINISTCPTASFCALRSAISPPSTTRPPIFSRRRCACICAGEITRARIPTTSRSPRSSTCACGQGRPDCRSRRPIRATRRNGRICATRRSPTTRSSSPASSTRQRISSSTPGSSHNASAITPTLSGASGSSPAPIAASRPSPSSTTPLLRPSSGQSLRRWPKGHNSPVNDSGVKGGTRMRSNITIWVTALLFATAAAIGAQAAEPRHFSFAYDQPHTTAYGIAADTFANKLQELSKGTLLIDQFPGAQLGQEPQVLQKLRTGDIDFAITSTANSATVQPESGVFSIHFVFRSEDHLKKALADPAVVAAFREMMNSKVEGAHTLALGTMGFRNIYSKREIHRLEDLKNVKVRVQATATEDTMFPAYGAQTIHMPFGDVYTSLQTGVVEAAENGINVYQMNKHYEVAPIMSLTEHEANNNVIWVSDKVWNSLNDEQKSWVQAAADEVGRTMPAKALDLEHASMTQLEKIGVKFVKDVDKSGFVKEAEPLQDQLTKQLGPGAVKVLQLVRNVQ